MKKFREILLQVWREACRQIDIGESTAAITQLLAAHLPVEQLLVRHIDREKMRLETVAVGFGREGKALTNAITNLNREQLNEILDWCRKGRVMSWNKGSATPSELDGLIAGRPFSNALAGPLVKEKNLLGVLVVITDPAKKIESRHIEMVKILLEPFSVALENDLRLREITALREAAEADRQSLLTKLSRRDVGDPIIGADGGLRAVMERVRMVAPSDEPVMIFGETGTGKELISREIHRNSRRSGGPFIRVNCGAIPAELIDSQLFGHERGAFTGAIETHKGWLERADGGTLFLDEIGELSLAAQVRLLRILQDGWLERIGSQRPIHIDVRVVVATHRDLAVMVSQGKFREDLWYRLAVFPIFLPPVRDRQEDIPPMANHFAERAAARFGLPVRFPTEEDIRILKTYPWPGNVRELASVINRAALLGNGGKLEVEKALGWMKPAEKPAPNIDEVTVATSSMHGSFPTLDEAMREHISMALEKCHGIVEGPNGAAALLKINPNTLRARMRKLKVEWRDFR